VNAQERWQALQATLKAARAAVESGDKTAALGAVNAALELDPDFLAAHSLRDRIIAGELPVRPAVAPPPHTISPQIIETSPIVSEERYAKFEQRARRRRVDRRIEAARQAIDKRRLKQAAAALDEVIELDPNLPELTDLTAQFDELRRSAATSHRGPWLAAAAVLAGSVFGASWLQESSPLFSRSMIAAAPLLAAPTPAVTVSSEPAPIATTGVTRAVESTPALRTIEPREVPAVVPVSASAAVRVGPEPIIDPPAITPSAPPPAPPVFVAPPRPPQDSAVGAPVAAPIPPKVEDIDEHAMVRQALQRYRSAYEELDAQSAHAVWPAVNQVALARAFEGLESQTITFDACDVRVRGEAATATCQGSARYIPKIGSRQPRIEPRVWNFTLHKAGDDWKIDSARAER
jgi:hypothetical protein